MVFAFFFFFNCLLYVIYILKLLKKKDIKVCGLHWVANSDFASLTKRVTASPNDPDPKRARVRKRERSLGHYCRGHWLSQEKRLRKRAPLRMRLARPVERKSPPSFVFEINKICPYLPGSV